VPERRSADDGLEFSNSSTLPNLKYFCIQKYQLKSHASCGHIPPTGKKTSRDDQTDTRDEEIESSKVRKFDGAPADIVDPQTKALS
jgi:hypothetical protein